MVSNRFNLVPRGRDPFGQRRGSRPLARFNSGGPRFTDFLSFCACSESSLTNLIGSGLNLLCLHSHPGVPIFPAHDKRDPWGRGGCNRSKVIFWCTPTEASDYLLLRSGGDHIHRQLITDSWYIRRVIG